MAKPELGEKRICGNCGAKFYDLNRDPIVCPKCDTVFEVVEPTKPAPAREAKKPAPVKEEPSEDDKDEAATDGPEIISLEDADEDEGDTVDGDDIADVDVDVDDDDDDDDSDDDTFLATDDEDDDDVSDIVPTKKDDDES